MSEDFLYQDFLDSPQEYDAARGLWLQALKDIAPRFAWKGYEPYLAERFADGTPIRNGNPMVSFVNWGRSRAARVIQNDPRDFGVYFNAYLAEPLTVKRPNSRASVELSELVISCTLTQETLSNAMVTLAEWLYGVGAARQVVEKLRKGELPSV